MQYPLYQVDAFTDRAFGGNPAAVMPLDAWLSDGQLQAIAAENNLSETAFLVPEDGAYGLRWFTPAVEVDLCGHATLASAHVLFEHLGYDSETILFNTRSGELTVKRDGDGYLMDFPSPALTVTAVSPELEAAMGATILDAALPVDNPSMMVCRFDSEAAVAALAPDFRALAAATRYCVIATAEGSDRDIVSRFFGPQVGIDEDPVTGSAHCCLTSYWAPRLGRNRLTARQISARVGELSCELMEGRVLLSGKAVTYLTGTVHRIA